MTHGCLRRSAAACRAGAPALPRAGCGKGEEMRACPPVPYAEAPPWRKLLPAVAAHKTGEPGRASNAFMPFCLKHDGAPMKSSPASRGLRRRRAAAAGPRLAARRMDPFVRCVAAHGNRPGNFRQMCRIAPGAVRGSVRLRRGATAPPKPLVVLWARVPGGGHAARAADGRQRRRNCSARMTVFYPVRVGERPFLHLPDHKAR
jgi:hypothetical protein